MHLAFGDRHPLVAAGVEPRQPEVVLAVEVGVLTPRVPPATLIVGRAVGRAGVLVAVCRAESVTVLEGQGVGGVATVTENVQPVTVGGVRYRKVQVVRPPIVAVYVGHLDAQRRRVVGRQPVDSVVPQPKIACEQRFVL